MSGLFIALSAVAAFGLIGWGIYAAVCQIACQYAAFSNSLQRGPDDFGDVHSEEY